MGISDTLDRSDIFWGCDSLQSVTIGMEQIPKALFSSRKNLKNVTIENTVKVIGEEAFENCDGLLSVTLPGSVTEIGKSAFASCSSLDTVILNEGLKIIGEKAFESCDKLTFPMLPTTVESIGTAAFAGLPMTKITPNMFPAEITALPDSMFSSCNSLTSVELPSTITSLGKSVFSYCQALESVTIPTDVTAIKDNTFIGCISLRAVTLPAGITDIGTSAFSNCDSLRSIELPANLIRLGENAFSSCDTLESIDLPDAVKEIGSYAFENCVMLETVDLSQSLESVDSGAFDLCKVLTSLEFPATLKMLSSINVFRWTPALRTVTFLGDAPKDQDGRAYTTSNPFGAKGGEGTGHNENLTIYYPADNASYADWAKWTYPKVVAGEKPTITDTIPAKIALSAILEQDPQGCLLLWLTVDVTHDTHPNDPTLAPSGNIQYFINNKQVFPDHFMGVPTALHKITGINIKDLESQTITVQAKLLASEGFSAAESAVLSGKVIMPSKNQQLPFVPDGSGPITPESQYETKPDADGQGVIITKILPPASTSPDLVLPTTLGGKAVTGLGENLFTGNVFAAYVTVPIGVKTLEAGAFKDCSHLRVISLPAGITSLPVDTFSGCRDLSSVNIPNTVGTIGSNAFKDCAKLEVMTFPASVTQLDKDALAGCDLKAVVFEGNAPTFTDGVPTAFGPETILYTEAGAEGFDVSHWKEMRREPVALGLDFNAVYVPATKSMLVTVKFDTSAYGPDAPAPDINKVVVRINNSPIIDGVTVNADKTISVPVPAKYDGQDAFVNIRYPGDWYYRESFSQSKSEILPYVKSDLTITSGTAAQVVVNANKTLTLVVTPDFTSTLPSNQAYKPKLDRLEVTLGGTPVTDFTVNEKSGSLSVDVTALADSTRALTLRYPGDYHLNPSNTYAVDVVIPALPVDPPPAPVTSLTATAGNVVRTGADCFLPITATLTVANPGNGVIDRAMLTVTLDGKPAEVATRVGDVLNVAIPANLLGKTVPVAVSYAGQVEYGYPAKAVSLAAVKLADPNPSKADTALNATAGAVVWYFATGTPTTSTYGLPLTPTLTHSPYTGDQGLTPNRAHITVTMDGALVSTDAFRWVNDTLYVDIPVAKLNTNVTLVLTYPGDACFNPSAKTISNVSLAYGTQPPPPSGGGGGSSTPAAKPSTGENAKVTVSNQDVAAAVKAAADSGSVVLKADTADNAKSVAVTVPASMMKAIAKAESPVAIQSPVADLTLDTKVLETLQRSGAKDVVVSAGAADTTALPQTAQTALEGRPVYDISITAGGKSVSQFGGGNVTVALPYTPADGESSEGLAACWVKEDGSMEVLRSSVYKDGKLTFSTPHLSTYAILHRSVSFLDVSSNLWFKNDIDFTVARGILNGMGDNGMGGELFGPGITLTGTMGVVALARMDGVADGAGDAWAAPALAWAAEKQILPKDFQADCPLTREQFSYLVAGYLGGAKKVDGPGYVDVTQISLPCLDSVNYLASLGVMNGTGDGCFSPKLTLTRSELAAVLHRLVLLQLG